MSTARLAPPLVIVDTNVLFDFFLGRDPDLPLLASLVPGKIVIRVPEFVLLARRRGRRSTP